MEGYLGSFEVDQNTTPFAKFNAADWAMWYIGSYGQIDGSHHKQWVLDQVARILKGTPVIVSERRWSPNQEYPDGLVEFDANTAPPSQEYLDWVVQMIGEDENGEPEYGYDEGISP